MSEEQKNAAAAPKKGGSRVIVIVVTSVLVVGAAVAGSLFGPRVLGAKPAAAAAVEESKDSGAPAGEVINFQPLVVDIYDKERQIHHLKVGLAAELVAEKTEAELKNYVPRGREAAIAYLRSREWDEITSAKAFEAIKKELSERVTASIGKERVTRVLVTDFVAQ
jgi:flagellar basal body-associated protein FliL